MYREQFRKDIDNWVAVSESNSIIDAFNIRSSKQDDFDGSYLNDSQHLKMWGYAFLLEDFLGKKVFNSN